MPWVVSVIKILARVIFYYVVFLKVLVYLDHVVYQYVGIEIGNFNRAQKGVIPWQIIFKKILFVNRIKDVHVVVEKNEFIRQPRYFMKMDMDRAAAKRGQGFMGHIIPVFNPMKLFVAQIEPFRFLSVRDEKYLSDPRGIFFYPPKPVTQQAVVPISLLRYINGYLFLPG